jgi:ppGpp synthetase/RelA/SpoT-type nucleotidyltranferase
MAAYRTWHKEQCAAYKADYPIFETFAVTLEKILKEICRSYAPLAIVQARAKTFSSFAEKMARKAQRYMALGIGPTDLCGARVIAETQAEVDRVSAVIRETFIIDEENSVDVSTRLKSSEFGYLSVHYVVQLRAKEICGVPVPPEIGIRKAEIQVRTLLQHAWASISHDRIYKASFRVPEHFSRELARVAAFLEEADGQFGSSVQALDSYKLHYGAYMDKDRLAEELEVLETVLDNEPDPARKPAAALRLAQVRRAAGDWTLVAELLEPYTKVEGNYQLELLAEHGHALCRLYRDQPLGELFRLGQAEIDQAAEKAQGNLRTRALAYRAWASASIPDNEEASREHFRAAHEADPKSPFHLASHIEYELYCGEPFGLHAMTGPALREGIATCRAYADAGIELPWAFLAMGRLYLLMNEAYESLAAYAKAIRLCLTGTGTAPKDVFDVELLFLRRINHGHAMPEAHDWVRRQLLLAKTVQGGAASAGLTARRNSFVPPVVILSGGTSPASQPTVDSFRDTVLAAFHGFRGTLISGGTTAGVAGLTGEIAANSPGAEVLGYLPRHLPYDQPIDRRYSAHVASEGATYGAGDPLQYWTDLILAGVRPSDVHVIGIDGGKIAGFEYRLALALGATVGLLEPATRSAASLQRDPDWKTDRNLLAVPKDAMTLRAFVPSPSPALTKDQVEAAAHTIHDQFLAENRYKNPDPAMKHWAELADDLKNSNRMQASRIVWFLEEIGYRLEPAEGSAPPITLSKPEIEELAEMEHGRWVIERLQSGWHYSAKRDPAKTLSPHLVPWNALSDEVKGYDRNTVASWPSVLAQAGLRIVRR